MTAILEQRNLSDVAVWLVMILGFLLGIGWLGFAIWVTPVTTNWLMSTGMGFVLKPFEKAINKRLDKTLEDGCSEFNRVTGQVHLALGGGRFFQATFVEFDAYVDRVIQQSGVFYRLILVHRYTQKSFHNIPYTTLFRSSNPASTIPAEEASAPARSQALSSGNAAARQSRVSFPLSAADLPPSPTKSSNLSETAEVPACNVPSRSPLPALAIAPETKLGTASSGLGTLEP